MNTLEQIYDNTRQLIHFCEEHGYPEEQNSLQEAMTTNYTFGEIICDIGCALDALVKEKGKYPEEFVSKANETMKLIKNFRC